MYYLSLHQSLTTGIVDENVDVCFGGENLLCDALNVTCFAHVCKKVSVLLVGILRCGKRRKDALDSFLAASEEDEPVTLAGQLTRRAFANAACRSGNHNHF
jgi:hypothetical protein